MSEIDHPKSSVQEGAPGKTSLSIKEAASFSRVCNAAIYIAVQKGSIKARKENNQWVIELEDLQEYRRNKYSKHKALFNGEPLYNKEKGEWSIIEVAKYLGMTIAHTYYAVQQGYLPATKKGAVWIIQEADMRAYHKKKTNVNQMQFA